MNLNKIYYERLLNECDYFNFILKTYNVFEIHFGILGCRSG